MTNKTSYFLTNPLEDSLGFLNDPSLKCIQKEALDIQLNLRRAGWTPEAMEAVHHVLENIKVQTLEFLVLNKETFPVISAIEGIPKDLLNDMRESLFGGRTFGDIYELALNYYRKYNNEEMLITLQPPINADLLRFSIDNIPKIFINEVINSGFGEITVREIYGIAYFSNLWVLNKPGFVPFTNLYWHKNLTLLAETFNCVRRLATSGFCCRFSDLLERPQDLATKEFDYNTQLASDRAKLILKENYSRSKGGKGKKAKSRQFTIQHYKTNQSHYKNKTQAARAIYKLLQKEDFYKNEKFSSEKQGLRTIKGWIKLTASENDLCDGEDIVIKGIKKLRDY